MSSVAEWRRRWESAGFATIPLHPGTKKPMYREWQHTPPAEQWYETRTPEVNLGVRAGNGYAIVDCDDTKSLFNVTDWSRGIGLEAPVVITPSGGRHVYLRTDNVPANMDSWSKLPPDVGGGEFRFGPSSQTAAPNSVVDSRQYSFERGGPEELAGLPVILWQDLQWLLPDERTSAPTKATEQSRVPIPLPPRELPGRARILLRHLQGAAKSEPVLRYPTRSEAEAAVVAICILAGHTFERTAKLFEFWQPGHYWEYDKGRLRYLSRTWRKVLGLLAANPERQHIADVYRQAWHRPWPGRGGNGELTTYCALLSLCWQWSSWEVAAAQRDLLLCKAGGTGGVRGGLERLRRAQLVAPLPLPRERQEAVFYRVLPFPEPLPHTPTVTYGPFRHTETWAALGWSLARLYVWLREEARGVAELVELTGMGRRTAHRSLTSLEQWGLAEKSSGGYVRGGRKISELAEVVDADGRGQRRQAKVKREREVWRKRLR